MLSDKWKVNKLLKTYYRGELMKIQIPKSPLIKDTGAARNGIARNGVAAALLSLALTAASLLFLASGLTAGSTLSPLAGRINVFSAYYKWDLLFIDGINYLKKCCILRHKEE